MLETTLELSRLRSQPIFPMTGSNGSTSPVRPSCSACELTCSKWCTQASRSSCVSTASMVLAMAISSVPVAFSSKINRPPTVSSVTRARNIVTERPTGREYWCE